MPSATGAPRSAPAQRHHRLRVGRGDRADPGERQHDEPRPADDVGDRDGAVAKAHRESAELLRLSPIIHSAPAGTVTGPNTSCRAVPAFGEEVQT